MQLSIPQVATYVPPGIIPSTVSYTGRVDLEIKADSGLENASIGGRMVTIPHALLSHIPNRWRLPASEHDIEDSEGSSASVSSAHHHGTDASGHPSSTHDAATLSAMTEDYDENPYKYMLTMEFPGSKTFNITTGSLKYKYQGRPQTPLPGALLATEGSSSNTARPGSASTKGKPDPKAAPAKDAKDAKGKGAAEEKKDDPPTTSSAPAVEGIWLVDFKEARIFLTKPTVQSLIGHLKAGAALTGFVRRVHTEPMEDDDPDDFSIAPMEGRRVDEEDYNYRGEIALHVDHLLTPGVTTSAQEVNIQPSKVSETEKTTDSEAKTKRDTAWTEYLATKGSGKSAATGKDSKGGKSPAKGGKPDPKAAAKTAPGKGPAVDPKKGAAKPGAKPATPEVPETPATPPPHPYEASSTILSINLIFNSALNPRPPTPPPVPVAVSDLIPPRGSALPAPPSIDASQEFRREVATAVTTVAKEYAAIIEAANQSVDSSLPIEERRRQLLMRLKETGAYEGIRDSLKQCAARVVRERFIYMPGFKDANGTAGRDELLSHVYAYLIGQMHAALNATFTDAETIAPAPVVTGTTSRSNSPGRSSTRTATRNADASNESKTSSSSSPSSSSSSTPVAAISETPLLRLRRIALESEYSGHYERAARVHQVRVALAEEAAARGQTQGRYDPSVWHDYGTYCLRRGELMKAATCLREALSCDSNFIPSLLALAALQCSRNKADEAMVYCASAVTILTTAAKIDKVQAGKLGITWIGSESANLLPLAHALNSLSLQIGGRSKDSGAALVSAIACLAELYVERSATKDDVACSATAGGVYLLIARYLLDLHLNDLSRISIEQAHSALLDTDAPRIQRVDILVLRVRQFMQAMNALKTYELTEYIPTGPNEKNPNEGRGRRLDNATGLLGNASNTIVNTLTNNKGPTSSTGVAISFTGRAYDGSLLAADEASKTLLRACEISSLVWEAWSLRAEMWLTGLLSPHRKKSVTGIDSPLLGTPDLGDMDMEDLIEGRRWLELAVGNFVEPYHIGYAQLISKTKLSMDSVPSISVANTGARADAIFSSFSGVGGGLFGSDEYTLVRLYNRLATVQLQLAAVSPATEAPTVLRTARESYVRAVQAGRTLATAYPTMYSGPWCLSWLGIGRAAWAEGHSADAETVLGEANALDNQNPVVWAWLSYLCLHAEPLRDREAAASLDNALKNNLSGDCTETAILLHTLADRYRNLGQAHVAAGLLRRAVLRMHDPVSGAHLDAVLHARLALAEVLAEGGALEDALNQYRAVMMTKGVPGIHMSITMKDSLRATRIAATAAAATLLTKLGRQSEADNVMTIYGASGKTEG